MSQRKRSDQDLDRMETELWNALDEHDPAEKDYFIRSALQDLQLFKNEVYRRENAP